MARKTARPGRTLAVFFLGLAIAFGLVALGGTWKPELGLDLQGGTSIRLTPKGDPSAESLNEARKIIDQRVNGSGVAEAEVTVQGNKYIVVEIPGQSRRDLVDSPIAAPRYDERCASIQSGRGELACMARALGHEDVGDEAVGREE